jgi:hypothetical protein
MFSCTPERPCSWRRSLRTSAFRRGGVRGAVLFAVAPIHVEAVHELVGRGEVLAAVFTLLYLHFALRQYRHGEVPCHPESAATDLLHAVEPEQILRFAQDDKEVRHLSPASLFFLGASRFRSCGADKRAARRLRRWRFSCSSSSRRGGSGNGCGAPSSAGFLSSAAQPPSSPASSCFGGGSSEAS